MNPCRDVNQMTLYCLAYAAQQHGIDLHSLIAMGNHLHETATDRKAELPDFCEWAHGIIARALNRWMDREGCFWEGTRSYNACLLGVEGEIAPIHYAQDLLDKMVYCALNPVRAGLVKHARDWPGINSSRWHFGEPVTVERPDFFFSQKTNLPSEVTFTLVKPPGFEDLDDAAFDRLFQERVKDGELEIRRAMRAAGRQFAGPSTVLKQERTAAPKTKEEKREFEPQVASRDPIRRVTMLELIAAFHLAYSAAREAWLAGDEEAEFPAGTFKVRRETPARCRGPDPAYA